MCETPSWTESSGAESGRLHSGKSMDSAAPRIGRSKTRNILLPSEVAKHAKRKVLAWHKDRIVLRSMLHVTVSAVRF